MVLRYQVRWNGFPGAPGFSAAYAPDPTPAQTLADEWREFLSNLVTFLPNTVQLVPDSVVETFDTVTGIHTIDLPVTKPPNINGTSASNYAGPAGAAITWRTQGLANRRRILGRTFLVPLSSFATQTDGTLSPTFISTMLTAADAWIGGGANPVVWKRPVLGANGRFSAIQAGTITDQVAVLRSRRS